MRQSLRVFILLLALLFAFTLTYYPHYDDPYPLHLDEWQHLARIIYFQETVLQTIPNLFTNLIDNTNIIPNPTFTHLRNTSLPADWIAVTYDPITFDNYYLYLWNFSNYQDALKETGLLPFSIVQKTETKQNIAHWNFSLLSPTLSEFALRTNILSVMPGIYDLTLHYETTPDFSGKFFLELILDSNMTELSNDYYGWEFYPYPHGAVLRKIFEYPHSWSRFPWVQVTPRKHDSSYDRIYIQNISENWKTLHIKNIQIPIKGNMTLALIGYCAIPPCTGNGRIQKFTLSRSHFTFKTIFQSLWENPYFSDHPYQPNLEPGFHILLGIFTFPFNLILIWRYLPAFFAVLSALALFLLLRFTTKSFWTGIFAILLFTSLKSNVNILGLWFLTPLTMAIPFLFLSLYFYLVAFENDSRTYYSILIILLILLLLVHPLSALFTLLIISAHLLLHFFSKPDRWRFLLMLLIPSLLLLFLFFFTGLYQSGEFLHFARNFLVFQKEWGRFEHIYFIPKFYGYFLTLFAFIGIYPAIKNKRFHIFLIGPLIAAFLTLFFYLQRFTPFIPYQRAVYYLLLSLVPLTAIGLYTFLQFSQKAFLKKLAIPIIFLVLLSGFSNYTQPPAGLELYHLVDASDYAAFSFIKEHYRNKIVLTSQSQTATVYPLSKNYGVWLINGTITGRNIPELHRFPDASCAGKKEILERNKIDLILVKEKISCDDLEEVYNKQVFLYEYDPKDKIP